MFLEESDLTPLEEHFDELISGLTDWEPEMKEKGLIEPEMVTVKGDDYEDAVNKTRYLFYRNLWSDSLPIEPPTEKKVEWILTGTDRDADEVIGAITPRGGVATVNAVAVALAMAGGRPEYMPVLIAITEALVDPELGTQGWSASTHSAYPVVIVSGPIAQEIRLGCRYGMFGPDPVHPAGQILGRAVRLLLQDVGGAIPGSGTMAVFGGMRSNNAVFAEDLAGLPEGWKSLAEEHGYTRDQNVIAVTIANSMENVVWDFGGEEANLRSLRAMASHMTGANPRDFSGKVTDGIWGAIVIPSGFATALNDDNGWTKDEVRQYIWEQSASTYEEWTNIMGEFFTKDLNPGDMAHCTGEAKNLNVVVGGGDQAGHGYLLCGLGTRDLFKEIELPEAWDDLLYEAEMDIGALPATL